MFRLFHNCVLAILNLCVFENKLIRNFVIYLFIAHAVVMTVVSREITHKSIHKKKKKLILPNGASRKIDETFTRYSCDAAINTPRVHRKTRHIFEN